MRKPECGASDGIHEGNLYTFVDLHTGRSGSFVRCYDHMMEFYRKSLESLSPDDHSERESLCAERILLQVAEGKLTTLSGGPPWKYARLKSLGPMG
jgi:hypothetical protein